MLAGLTAAHHTDRLKALEDLRAVLHRSAGGGGDGPPLRFRAADRLCGALAVCLRDQNWTVRRDTVALLGDVGAPPPDLQRALAAVLPPLVGALGDPKVAIRRAAGGVLEVGVCGGVCKFCFSLPPPRRLER